jgi:hypothetical protein
MLGSLVVYLSHGLKVDAGLGICSLLVIEGNAWKQGVCWLGKHKVVIYF